MDQQQLIDAVTQQVGVALVEGLFERDAGEALAAKRVGQLFAAVLDVAAGDDVAVAFGDEFFDHAHVGGEDGGGG
jgi:hypothetical protein